MTRRFSVAALTLAAACGLASCEQNHEKPPKRPSDWHFVQRTFPFFEADPSYREALARRKQLLRSRKALSFGEWEFIGPDNVGGRISDVEFNPLDPSIVYASAATGGVLKSIDGGASWTPVFDDQAVLTVGDIGVDPQRPETLYVGTGEANGGHNNFAGGGIYKSVDGGSNWSYAGLEETVTIGRVVVDHANSDRIFVAAAGSYFAPHPERGVFRSTDGAATWEKILAVDDSTGAIDLVMHPTDPNVLYASTWTRVRRPEGTIRLYGHGSAIHRSLDGGETWIRLGPERGLPDPTKFADFTGVPRIGRIGLTICRDNPQVLYALFTNGSGYLNLYRTDDGGESWRVADQNRALPSSGFPGNFSFSWYFGQVRVNPTDPDDVYVLDVSLFNSKDGGVTWTSTRGTHVDYHGLAFHPHDASKMINGNDGGLAGTDRFGGDWIKLGSLPVTQFYEINFDPSNPERLFGGTQDNGTVRTLTGGRSDWQEIFGGDGFYVNIDPTDPNIVYAESQFGNLVRSTNGGLGFSSATNGITDSKRNWSTPVVLDPNNPSILYLGATRVFRSMDRALTWTAVSDKLPDGDLSDRLGTITTIAVAPSNSQVIYVGTDDGRVWVSSDFAQTWTDVTGGLPYRWVTRIAVHPSSEDVAYVTYSGLKWRDPQPHVFKTTNQGRSWSDVSGNLPDAPVNALAIDPDRPDVVYIGNDVGAFVSVTGGTSWDVLGGGLPAVPVYDLKVISSTRTLLAGTHGRSMYGLDISSPVTAVENVAQYRGPELSLSSPYPNPGSGPVTIPLALSRTANVQLEIFDLLGRRVRARSLGMLPLGTAEVSWDGKDQNDERVATGAYFIRVTAQLGDATRAASTTVYRYR